MKMFLRIFLVVIAIVCILVNQSAGAGSSLPEPVVSPAKLSAQPQDLPVLEQLTLDKESYPVTDGSTSAEPLGIWVAARLLNLKCKWHTGHTAGERHLIPLRKDDQEGMFVAEDPGYEDNDSKLDLAKLRHSGTHNAYRKLIKGNADLIYECRRPSRDEKQLLEKHGIALEITPIALDAFVFLRHKDNSVTELSAEEVREIYTRAEDERTGEINNWQQVGGPNETINPYVRNRNSGSQETMKSLVMKDRNMVSGRNMTGMTMRGPYNHMSRDRAGIGFTFFYYQRYMAPRPTNPNPEGDETEDTPLAMFAIDDVQPSRKSVADGTYRWVTEVYAITRKDLDADHPASKLKDWLLTNEGQKVIAETGYIPLPQDQNGKIK